MANFALNAEAYIWRFVRDSADSYWISFFHFFGSTWLAVQVLGTNEWLHVVKQGGGWALGADMHQPALARMEKRLGLCSPHVDILSCLVCMHRVTQQILINTPIHTHIQILSQCT